MARLSTELSSSIFTSLLTDGLLRPGDRVLVAVSGGADSVALLHLLGSVAADIPIGLAAAHLDHGLRAESGRDADFVRDLCRKWAIPLSLQRCEVAAEARHRGLGLEETGREMRRDFLRQTAHRQGCRLIALGHHRGDQAETVLHRLLRGSGASGLSGMSPLRGPFLRPLLGVTRRQILDYLTERGILWVEDETNTDPAFTRNRIRHALLPHLAEFNPRIEETLARLGERLSLEEDFWRQEAERILSGLILPAEGGLRLDRQALLALHPAMRGRVLRRALGEVRGGLGGISARHLHLLDELITDGPPQADLHLPGSWAGCRYGAIWLRLSPPLTAAGFSFEIAGPGRLPLPMGELVVSLHSRPLGEDADTVEFDPAAVPFPLTVRSIRPGDRLRPLGMAGRKKVKDILMEARVEREFRQRIPVVEGEEILWIAGLRRCAGRCPADDGPALRLHFRHPES